VESRSERIRDHRRRPPAGSRQPQPTHGKCWKRRKRSRPGTVPVLSTSRLPQDNR